MPSISSTKCWASSPSLEVLRKRTDDYHHWVDAYARKRKIPMEWAEKGVRKEDYARSWLRRMERHNQHGVYFIFKSLEQGRTFRSVLPKFPTDDPDYRILHKQRSRRCATFSAHIPLRIGEPEMLSSFCRETRILAKNLTGQ